MQAKEDSLWKIPKEHITFGIELGRGAFATVLKGEWRGLSVAVKRFDVENLDSEYHMGEWTKELRINARFRHPNIVQFFGACVVLKNYPLVVMELLPASLRDVLIAASKSATRLTLREQVDILCDSARGLASIHSEHVTHGDIAEANVLVSEQLLAKLSDLGEAHIMKRTLTHLNPIHPDYCAPERNGTAAIDAYKADYYSLGVVIIQTSSGLPPDRARREAQLLQVPNSEVRALARKCIDKDPARRPSMEEILASLLKIQQTGKEYNDCPPRRRVVRRGMEVVLE